MRKLLIGALLCPFFSNCTPAGNKPPFSVGDAFQPFTVTSLVNSTAPYLFIPTVGNKVYILNFVAVGCSACVKDYPRLDSLQKVFGKGLQIILITVESRDRVERFRKETKSGQRLNLPIATGDTLLGTWFPHRFLSHTVWLQGGRVKGITSPEYITQNNIEILQMGRDPGWPVKKDDVAYNDTEPLLKSNPLMPAFQSSYTMLTPHIPGLVPGFHQTRDSVTASIKTTILNKTILESYLYAYGLSPNFPVSGMKLIVQDTANYVYNDKTGYKLDWDLDHTFCYESVMTAGQSPAGQKRKLVADLDFYFGLISRFEKKQTNGFAMVKTDAKDAKGLLPTGAWPQYISLSNMVYYLNHHWYGIPVENQTGITEKQYIPFNADALASPEAAQSYLAGYGLALKPTKVKTDCLTLTEIIPHDSRN